MSHFTNDCALLLVLWRVNIGIESLVRNDTYCGVDTRGREDTHCSQSLQKFPLTSSFRQTPLIKLPFQIHHSKFRYVSSVQRQLGRLGRHFGSFRPCSEISVIYIFYEKIISYILTPLTIHKIDFMSKNNSNIDQNFANN